VERRSATTPPLIERNISILLLDKSAFAQHRTFIRVLQRWGWSGDA
jgi:hypothetical protein